MKVVDVSTICFESTSLKKTFKGKELEEMNELDKDNNNDADE